MIEELRKKFEDASLRAKNPYGEFICVLHSEFKESLKDVHKAQTTLVDIFDYSKSNIEYENCYKAISLNGVMCTMIFDDGIFKDEIVIFERLV